MLEQNRCDHVPQTKSNLQHGAFVPISNGEKLNVSENEEVEITVRDPCVVSATATSDEERERALRELIKSWQQHPLRGDAPRLTRDELHERR